MLQLTSIIPKARVQSKETSLSREKNCGMKLEFALALNIGTKLHDSLRGPYEPLKWQHRELILRPNLRFH